MQEARGAHQLRRAALPQRLAARQQHPHEDTRQDNRVDDREHPRNVHDMCVLGRRGGFDPNEGVARCAKVTTEEARTRGSERVLDVRVLELDILDAVPRLEDGRGRGSAQAEAQKEDRGQRFHEGLRPDVSLPFGRLACNDCLPDIEGGTYHKDDEDEKQRADGAQQQSAGVPAFEACARDEEIGPVDVEDVQEARPLVVEVR